MRLRLVIHGSLHFLLDPPLFLCLNFLIAPGTAKSPWIEHEQTKCCALGSMQVDATFIATKDHGCCVVDVTIDWKARKTQKGYQH